MKNISKIALWVLLAIGLVMTVLYFAFKGDVGGPTIDQWTYTYLNTAYAILALSVLLIILMPILTIKERKINFKSILILLVALVVIVGGAYLLAPGSAITLANGDVVEGSTTKLTDTALYITYFLIALSILAIIGGAIFNAAKKS